MREKEGLVAVDSDGVSLLDPPEGGATPARDPEETAEASIDMEPDPAFRAQ
jgi:hypothetical protein